MEFVRFRNLGAPYAGELNDLGVALDVVEFLPRKLTNLTISLVFYHNWEEGLEFIAEMDSMLATTSSVMSVEVIPWNPEYQEKMRAAFPKLLSSNKLDLKEGLSEASQIF